MRDLSVGVQTFEDFINVFKKITCRNHMNAFCKNRYTFFAKVSYTIQIPMEHYYQLLFFVVLSMLGADIDMENETAIGRIDAVIQRILNVINRLNMPLNKSLKKNILKGTGISRKKLLLLA